MSHSVDVMACSGGCLLLRALETEYFSALSSSSHHRLLKFEIQHSPSSTKTSIISGSITTTFYHGSGSVKIIDFEFEIAMRLVMVRSLCEIYEGRGFDGLTELHFDRGRILCRSYC